jgi:hypothetical protein
MQREATAGRTGTLPDGPLPDGPLGAGPLRNGNPRGNPNLAPRGACPRA